MKKIKILIRIFNDVKSMKKFGGFRFSLNDREKIIVRSYFIEHGLKATSIYNPYINQLKNEI